MERTDLIWEIGKLSSNEFQSTFRNVLREEGEEEALELLVLRCATDVELYAVFCFPHYCEFEFNAFHKEVFGAFQFGERQVRRARGAPRGSAKSTILTLIKPLHDVSYGLENFILVVSSTEPLAIKKLKDIRAEVETNPVLSSVYGIAFQDGKAADKEFTVVSHMGATHFAARGKGAQVRGIRYKQHRPSKLLFDDFEISEEVANDRLRKKTEDVFKEEFGKTGDTRTNIEFVGTVLHKMALLPSLVNNPAYDGKIFKSVISWSEREDLWNQWRAIYTNIDNDRRLEEAQVFYELNKEEMLKGTQVLWPEKRDYLALMKDMVEIGRRAFFKEEQNEPLGADESVFDTIHWYREVKEGFLLDSGPLIPWSEVKHTALGALDPATGQTKPKKGKLGDFAVQLTGYKDSRGRLFVHHDITKRIPPTKQIENIFDGHEKFTYQKFAVETNLYRNLLLPNIIAERKRREEAKKQLLKIPFYDVVQTENKEARIFTLEPKVSHGWIVFNRNLSQDFKLMLEDFPHAENDDGPDCLEMLWSLAENRYRPSADSISVMANV